MAKAQVVGIVVAAGSGQRLGADVPKAFVEIGGRPLLAWAVDALRRGGIDDLVVVAPAGWEEQAGAASGPGATIVTGGATRTDSVAAGLAAVSEGAHVVAVHDAARALTPPDVVASAVRAVVDSIRGFDASHGPDGSDSVGEPGQDARVVAAAPGVAVTDTLKRVDGDGSVAGTIDRHGLVGIQTPQVFRRDILALAHRHAAQRGDSATDDLALVEDLVTARHHRGTHRRHPRLGARPQDHAPRRPGRGHGPGSPAATAATARQPSHGQPLDGQPSHGQPLDGQQLHGRAT